MDLAEILAGAVGLEPTTLGLEGRIGNVYSFLVKSIFGLNTPQTEVPLSVWMLLDRDRYCSLAAHWQRGRGDGLAWGQLLGKATFGLSCSCFFRVDGGRFKVVVGGCTGPAYNEAGSPPMV